MRGVIVAGILFLVTVFAAVAVEPVDSTPPRVIRPVYAAYTVGVGPGELTDTYLSPIRYTGTAFSLNYERSQAMRFAPEVWTMRLSASLQGMHTRNIARNATMWSGELYLSWGMDRRWRISGGVTLAAGGSTSLSLGCLYNERNGNNPVSAKASWTVNLTGYASWNTRIGSLPVTLCYRPTFPVAGVFFSPDYGELYYEIYLGDSSGLCRMAWWGSYLSIDNLLTADFRFGATSLRVGYSGRLLSTKTSDINTRIISNSIVIGISGEWMSLDPRKHPSPQCARIISAL